MNTAYLPENVAPAIDEFIALYCANKTADRVEGNFPDKDKKKNQLVLDIDAEKLPPRHAKFLKALMVDGMTATDAARAAGYSEKSAAQQGSRLKKKLEADLTEQMDDAGLTVSHILNGVFEGTRAQMPRWNPEKKEFDMFPDYGNRHNYHKTAATMRGMLEGDHGGGASVIVLNSGVNRPGGIEIEAEVVEEGGEGGGSLKRPALVAETEGVS